MIFPILDLYDHSKLLGVVRAHFFDPKQLRPGTEIIFATKPSEYIPPKGDVMEGVPIYHRNTLRFRLHHVPHPEWEGPGPRLVFLQPNPLPACWKKIQGFQPR